MREAAVGIIATEPVINAMKYAYPHDGRGLLALKRRGACIDFIVADAGGHGRCPGAGGERARQPHCPRHGVQAQGRAQA